MEKEKGVFSAVSDNMKLVADQIAPWVPGGLTTLGTDGFGRSESREKLRRFFEVDAESTVIATLHALAQNAGRVLSRDALMEKLKGENLEAFDRSLDVHISRIRASIEDDPKHPKRIITVRGAGYVFARHPEA